MGIFSKTEKLLDRLKSFFKGVKKVRPKGMGRKKKTLEKTPPALLPVPSSPQLSFQMIRDFSLVQLSPHTRRAYDRDLKDFFAFILKNPELKLAGLDDFRAKDVAEFREFLRHTRRLSAGSISRKLAVLKSFFSWAQAQDLCKRNPAELVKSFPQTAESKTGYLRIEQIEQVLTYLEQHNLESDRLYAALEKVTLEVLLMLGIRRSEASSLSWGSIKFEGGDWLIEVKGKGARNRLLPIPPRLLESLQTWAQRLGDLEAPALGILKNPALWLRFFERIAKYPILISTRAKTFDASLSTSEIARIVRKACRKAGIIERVHPHMLRSSAITHALDQGASHRGVQQMAGWTSPLMLNRYDKRRNDPRLSAVNNLSYAQRSPHETTSSDSQATGGALKSSELS